MNSREILRRTLDFEYPERVAHSFSPSDMVVGKPEIPNPEGEWKKINSREWHRIDEWGNVWGRLDDSSMGEIIKGALENINEAETFQLPDFSNPEYYKNAKEIFSNHPNHWHNGLIRGFHFSLARKLRRMETYLIDLVVETEKISMLHDRIDEQIKFEIKRMAEIGADSIMVEEDWGTQYQTLISPAMWKNIFKPRFTDICSYAHKFNLKVFFHSCGKMTDIIPDLIDSGIDVLQFDQPGVHGIDTLKNFQQKEKITFWCPVDIQTTLQTKDENLIRKEARELLEKLWRGRGGFIAGCYPDNSSIGLEPKWQEIAGDEFLKRGKKEFFSSD